MNYRNRLLLNLCYALPCQAQIPGVCVGGQGEPMHANWAQFGKGGAMKAHDAFCASGCRSCHVELDQGKNLTDEQRFFYWLQAYTRTQAAFWKQDLVCVNQNPRGAQRPVAEVTRTRNQRKTSKTGHANGQNCARPSKSLPNPFAA